MSDFKSLNKSVDSTLVGVDSPDDFPNEGQDSAANNRAEAKQGDQDTLVAVDSPDDFQYEGEPMGSD